MTVVVAVVCVRRSWQRRGRRGGARARSGGRSVLALDTLIVSSRRGDNSRCRRTRKADRRGPGLEVDSHVRSQSRHRHQWPGKTEGSGAGAGGAFVSGCMTYLVENPCYAERRVREEV